MSDNSNQTELKKLRNEVQLLRDELAIMKRKYEDIIYNLDTDNFSGRFVAEYDNMKTDIKVTAEGIKSQVTKEDLDTELGKTYSSIMEQTADKISAEVTALAAKDEELSTKITQTADKIESQVTHEDLNEALTQYSKVTQTAESISAAVQTLKDADAQLSSQIDLNSTNITSVVAKNISAKFIKSDARPNYDNTTTVQKSMLCEYKGQLYYYNDITETWKLYPYATDTVNGEKITIKSQFVQTSSGFDLTGDVSISGDAVVGGTITGAALKSADSGDGYSQMDSGGLTVYDDDNAPKIGLGYVSAGFNHPYLILGQGAGYSSNGQGIVYKLGCGLWIGESSIMYYGGDLPGNSASIQNISNYCPNATGIFIDFENDKIYKYLKGVPTAL